jgi:hypothetical protein
MQNGKLHFNASWYWQDGSEETKNFVGKEKAQESHKLDLEMAEL